MNPRWAAFVGAVGVTAAAILQDYNQGDSLSVVKIGVWLLLGSLIGLGVAKFVNRSR